MHPAASTFTEGCVESGAGAPAGCMLARSARKRKGVFLALFLMYNHFLFLSVIKTKQESCKCKDFGNTAVDSPFSIIEQRRIELDL